VTVQASWSVTGEGGEVANLTQYADVTEALAAVYVAQGLRVRCMSVRRRARWSYLLRRPSLCVLPL
jgi:hypothetical protein